MLADVWNLYPCTNPSTKSPLIWLLLGGLPDFSFCLSLSDLLLTGASTVITVKLSKRFYVNSNFKTRKSTKNVEPRMWSNQLFQCWKQSLATYRLEIYPRTHNDVHQRLVRSHLHMPCGENQLWISTSQAVEGAKNCQESRHLQTYPRLPNKETAPSNTNTTQSTSRSQTRCLPSPSRH